MNYERSFLCSRAMPLFLWNENSMAVRRMNGQNLISVVRGLVPQLSAAVAACDVIGFIPLSVHRVSELPALTLSSSEAWTIHTCVCHLPSTMVVSSCLGVRAEHHAFFSLALVERESSIRFCICNCNEWKVYVLIHLIWLWWRLLPSAPPPSPPPFPMCVCLNVII